MIFHSFANLLVQNFTIQNFFPCTEYGEIRSFFMLPTDVNNRAPGGSYAYPLKIYYLNESTLISYLRSQVNSKYMGFDTYSFVEDNKGKINAMVKRRYLIFKYSDNIVLIKTKLVYCFDCFWEQLITLTNNSYSKVLLNIFAWN